LGHAKEAGQDATMRTRALVVVGILAFLACTAVVVFVVNRVTESLEAERTYLANRVVLEVVTNYLKDHPEGWPKNWEELRDTPADAQGFRGWPENIEEIRRRIRVDFALTRPQVAAMNAETFSAVEPIGPNFGPDESAINQLLSVAREKK
jgi:hypothetical protein